MAPKGGQVRRADDDTAVVTCANSDDVWYLTCRGDSWVGKYGNCSHGQFLMTSICVFRRYCFTEHLSEDLYEA